MAHFIIDCDDVLLDWQNAFIKHCRFYGITLDPAGPQSWDLSQWMGLPSATCREWINHFNNSHAFGRIEACEGAKEFLWTVRDNWHTCNVLTACGTDENIRQARFSNMRACFQKPANIYGFSLPYDAITFLPLGGSKFHDLNEARLKCDDIVFVEDSFKHAQSGVANGIKSYCLRRSHNRQDEADNPDSGVIWVDDLSCIPIPLLID